MKRTLGHQMAARPLLLLGGALGAGYVVGGGLASPLTGQLVRLGGSLAWRLMVLPVLQQGLQGALGGVAGVEHQDM